jgi:hypothetical protein
MNRQLENQERPDLKGPQKPRQAARGFRTAAARSRSSCRSSGTVTFPTRRCRSTSSCSRSGIGRTQTLSSPTIGRIGTQDHRLASELTHPAFRGPPSPRVPNLQEGRRISAGPRPRWPSTKRRRTTRSRCPWRASLPHPTVLVQRGRLPQSDAPTWRRSLCAERVRRGLLRVQDRHLKAKINGHNVTGRATQSSRPSTTCEHRFAGL